MKDTARVLGRMYDAIEYRGAGQEIVEELAEYAGVPVFNGLTDEFHPTQMLADVLTMTEHCPKPLTDIAFAFVGDGTTWPTHCCWWQPSSAWMCASARRQPFGRAMTLWHSAGGSALRPGRGSRSPTIRSRR
jgi:ornithine carbamoyltransferase